jgi:hypothetical protein
VIPDQIAKLLRFLGYDTSPGYLPMEQFPYLARHRHALMTAAKRMGVVGAFGLGDPLGGTFTPVVFIASAPDANAAKDVHRSVWSQGLAAYTVIVTALGYHLCGGFSFKSKDWFESTFVGDDLSMSPALGSNDTHRTMLRDLSAWKLRSSLAWRDELLRVEDRVDEVLLRNLQKAGRVLRRDERGYGKLARSRLTH